MGRRAIPFCMERVDGPRGRFKSSLGDIGLGGGLGIVGYCGMVDVDMMVFLFPRTCNIISWVHHSLISDSYTLYLMFIATSTSTTAPPTLV